MLLRAGYFTRTELALQTYGMSLPIQLPAPTVEDASRAFAQIRLLTLYATLLPFPSSSAVPTTHSPTLPGDELGQAPLLRSVSMGSLSFVIDFTPEMLAAGSLGLLTLAHQICTFLPRVSAKREELLLEAYKARSERERLELEAAAAPLAALLRDAGPSRHEFEQGPDHIDLVDDEDDEVVEWDPEAKASG
jgi:hypothetical protein